MLLEKSGRRSFPIFYVRESLVGGIKPLLNVRLSIRKDIFDWQKTKSIEFLLGAPEVSWPQY